MTDIGNRRPPHSGMVITASDSTTVLMPAVLPPSGAAGHSGSTSYIQADVTNGIANYSEPSGGSPGSERGTTVSSPGHHSKEQASSFVLLPNTFRGTSDGITDIVQSQIQQRVSSVGMSHQDGSPVSAMSPVKSISQHSPNSVIPTDQAVRNAVNWIVQDAKQRQQRPPIQQTVHNEQQMFRRIDGKMPGQHLTQTNIADNNLRKFSTSATMQQEQRYFSYNIPPVVSHSEPSTPHPGQSGLDVIPMAGRHHLTSVNVPNGSVPSPATGTAIWRVSDSTFNGGTDEHGPIDGGPFPPSGDIYHESDLGLSSDRTFVGGASTDGNTPRQMTSAMLISPTASTLSEAASSGGSPPVTNNNANNTNNRSTQPKSATGKSGKSSTSGGGAFCAFEERQCKQRCINGYRHCIRHILCDPNSPYRPCNYVKKQGTKEIPCSNAVALSQGTEFCSTHLIMMGMKEAKRKKPAATSGSTNSAGKNGPIAGAEMNGTSEKASPVGQTAPAGGKNKKKVAAKKSNQMETGNPAKVGASAVYPQQVYGNGLGQHGSPGIQYHQHPEQAIYSNQYGQQQQQGPSQQPSQAFLGNGKELETASTSAPAPVANGLPYYGQHPQQQQHIQMEDEFRRPYYVGRQHFEMGYEDGQGHYQPQAMAYPQQQFDVSQQHQPSLPSYNFGQSGQVMYDQQVHPAEVYGQPYSTAVDQQHHVHSAPALAQQHRQDHYDQISMPPPASLQPGPVVSPMVTAGHAYPVAAGEYPIDSSSCPTSTGDQTGQWRASPGMFNQPQVSPQKMMGPVYVMYQNGDSSEIARTHPELAAHLLHTSNSPQSAAGNGTNSGAGGVYRQPFRQHHLQAQQATSEPGVDDSSVQGFARVDGSYLISSDDPFLGTPSSSGFSTDGASVGANTSIGAAGMTVGILSPMSSEMSESSPVVTAPLTQTDAGVGYTQHQQPKQAYLYQNANHSLVDHQSKQQQHATHPQSMITLDASQCKLFNMVQSSQTSAHSMEKIDGDSMDPLAPVPSTAPATNKKVIRLKQKKRHLRMVGPYRQIPVVSQMCKVLEDLDFDRKDLFPLGLEPSSSDTDSDDEDHLPRSFMFEPSEERAMLARKSLMEKSNKALSDEVEENDGSCLSARIVSKARRQLYLLKKTLRLDESRIRRRVGMESRVLTSASRLYPNSVGAALVDRRRHRIRPHHRRTVSYLRSTGSSDSKKHLSGGKKTTGKVKKPGNAADADGNAELELKRALATRRCTFESPATLVLVQHTGPNGSVEHRRQVLAQHRCGDRSLPYSNFCLTHVLHNEDQQLYRKCAYSDCHRPAVDLGSDAAAAAAACCPAHSNRQSTRVSEGFNGNHLPTNTPTAAAEDGQFLQQEPFRQEHDQQQKAGNKAKKIQQKDATSVDTDGGPKRKKKKGNAKDAGQTDGNADAQTDSRNVQGRLETSKLNVRASSSTVTKDDEAATSAQEALTLASVAQDFGFEDHELTEMLIRLPEEAFDGILESADLTRTGPGVITVTDSGGGNDSVPVSQALVPPSSSAVGVDAIERAVQAATSSCSHNWADVEQFLLSEGYCGGTGGAVVPGVSAAPFTSPPPAAYTNLTNTPVILEQNVPSANFDLHSQAGAVTTSAVWPTSIAAPIAPVDSYQRRSVDALPSISVYSATTPALVNEVNEQNVNVVATSVSSWNNSSSSS